MIYAPTTQFGFSSVNLGSSQGVKINVSVSKQADMFMGLARATFAAFGLNNDAIIARFHTFIGSNELQRFADNFRRQTVAINQMNSAKNLAVLKTSVYVHQWFIDKVREFGIDFNISNTSNVNVSGINPKGNDGVSGDKPVNKPVPLNNQTENISDWTTLEKVGEVIKRAASMLPGDVGEELLALLKPEVLAVIAVVVAIWAVGHFFVVSEVVDVILLGIGVIALGAVAWKAGNELINFGVKTVNARNEDDLNQAAKHLSDAVALIGVQGVMALVVKFSPKGITGPVPYTVKTLPRVPVTKGSIFYKPKIIRTKSREYAPGEGMTDEFGNIIYSSRGSYKTQALARVHEKVHSFLTPKLQIFREIRVVIGANSYSKSHILRYLEEAIAETIARVTVLGWREGFAGIAFPVKNGYVTIAAMGKEAAGILLGPVIVSGMLHKVYFTYTKPSENDWEEIKTAN